MTGKPFVIPIFITHQGCPHRCLFCNQQGITGCDEQVSREITALDVRQEIERCLAWPRKNSLVQVAFYGGSFTGLPESKQMELLQAVQPYLESGAVSGIRLSTRPDYIQAASPDFLHAQGVQIVELGVQSMTDRVLAACQRGHTASDTERAISVLKKGGMTVGAQLMIGLPGETTVSALAGARRVAALDPDMVRIYPVLVLKGSGLANLYNKGLYQPLSLPKAIAITGRIKEIFDRHGIRVIRMGLQPGPSLERELLAGPYHPGFGELVLSRLMFNMARKLLADKRNGGGCLAIAAADQSIFRGRHNVNARRLTSLGLLQNVAVVYRDNQMRGSVLVTESLS